MLQAVRELKASVEESHSEWLKVKWRDIVNIVSLKVLSELHLEQVGPVFVCTEIFLVYLIRFYCISCIDVHILKIFL